jgi:hypothetical protein
MTARGSIGTGSDKTLQAMCSVIFAAHISKIGSMSQHELLALVKWPSEPRAPASEPKSSMHLYFYVQRLPPFPGPDEREGCFTSLMIGGC